MKNKGFFILFIFTFLRFVTFSYVEFGIVYNVYQFTLVPRYQPDLRQKARALTGSTFGMYSRFRSGMQTKQERVDCLNFI